MTRAWNLDLFLSIGIIYERSFISDFYLQRLVVWRLFSIFVVDWILSNLQVIWFVRIVSCITLFLATCATKITSFWGSVIITHDDQLISGISHFILTKVVVVFCKSVEYKVNSNNHWIKQKVLWKTLEVLVPHEPWNWSQNIVSFIFNNILHHEHMQNCVPKISKKWSDHYHYGSK